MAHIKHHFVSCWWHEEEHLDRSVQLYRQISLYTQESHQHCHINNILSMTTMTFYAKRTPLILAQMRNYSNKLKNHLLNLKHNHCSHISARLMTCSKLPSHTRTIYCLMLPSTTMTFCITDKISQPFDPAKKKIPLPQNKTVLRDFHYTVHHRHEKAQAPLAASSRPKCLCDYMAVP